VDNDFFDIYDNIQESSNVVFGNSDVYEKMIEGGYIVGDRFDELEILKLRHYSAKCDSSSCSLIIAPTMDCNFGCPYCYESRSKTYMSPEVETKIIEFVSQLSSSIRRLSIVWYGGEPLLAIDVIQRMSRKMIESSEQHNVEYSATMISNGYLIDSIDVEVLKQAKINNIQITIDGPEDIHNERRFLLNNHGPTFTRIISNIHLLEANGINYNIRVNVDNNNLSNVRKLLEYLKEQRLDSQPVSFGHVREFNRSVGSIIDDFCSIQEYTDINMVLQSKLVDMKFKSVSISCPQIRKTYCAANTLQSFVVDPLGYLYKCWNDIGFVSKSIGSIISNRKDNNFTALYNEYTLFNPFNVSKCRECVMLPTCMGGCVFDNINRKDECKMSLDSVIQGLKRAYYDITVKNISY
jgi:uncharacterized protein